MIQIELPPDVEARLAAKAEARGMDLASFAAHVLESIAPPPARMLSQEEIRKWLDEVAQFSHKIPAMPGETFSREMIYDGHD